MTPKRKQRLLMIIVMLLGASVSVLLLLKGLGENLNHYYELSVAKSNANLLGKTIRIGGIVELGSIKRYEGSLKVDFSITNLTETIDVSYEGVLPDLFKEGQGVLAKGQLTDQEHFIAQEILAKHDENYMPREVKQELESKGYNEAKTPAMIAPDATIPQ